MGKRKHRHRNNGAAAIEMRPEPISEIIEPVSRETLMIEEPERTFDAETVNTLLNHPTILPAIIIPGREGPLDASALIADPHNFWLMAPGGCIAFIRDEPGIYEVHTNFLPEYRGRNALRSSIAAYHWMFTRTDCMILQTRVPAPNRAADMFCKIIGATKEFTRQGIWPTDKGMVDLAFWQLHYHDWVRRAPSINATGRKFHEKLEAERIRHNLEEPLHADEECHDRHVGACVEMVYAGQPDKGCVLYNRFAAFAGYGKIALIARSPLVIDIGDAVLQVLDQDFKVLKFK
jgi:hypothetical protein